MCLCLCLFSACNNSGSEDTGTGADTGSGTQTTPEGAPIYTIVRSDSGNSEETAGAVKLRNTLREKYGIELELTTDWVKYGEDIEANRFANEILVGDTNRAESEALNASLNAGTADMLDYSITSNDSHYVIAATSGNMDAAIDLFLSYIENDLSMLYSDPVEMNESREHDFPLDDLTVCGDSIRNYDAIVIPASYNEYMKADVKAISDLLFAACGANVPVLRDDAALPAGKVIRIGARADEGVLSAGDFSYSLTVSEDGISIDGQDVWGDSRGVELLTTMISDGITAGGTLSLTADDSYRLENPADKEKILIAAWVISATDITDESQFAEIKDCGYNMVIIQKNSNGELFHKHCKWLAKYELKALWHDGDTYIHDYKTEADANGTMPELITITEDSDYLNTDITWGNMLRDEPNAAIFSILADAMEEYEAIADDDKIGYINLFPSYANEQQLGTATYEEHVRQFFDVVQPEYASVDIYPLNVAGSINSDYFYNLDVFATECRERDIPFAVYIQSVSFAAVKRTPDEREMRWQAWCCLSFGATNIEYFTYRTPNSSTEDFKDALIARSNEKTENWYGAQAVNRELNNISDAFMQYANLGAFAINTEGQPGYMQFSNQYGEFDAIESVTAQYDRPMLIGCFESDTAEHSRAFTCVNLGDPGYSTSASEVTVKLTEATTATLYYRDTVTTLTPDENGCISFTLEYGDGCFVTLGN